MKKSFPYVPWYQGDFLRSTNGWPLLIQAIYWKLLCSQWEQGPLPNDPEWLARIAGCTRGEFDIGWVTIASKFTMTKAGLVNDRMETHRSQYLSIAPSRAKEERRERRRAGVRSAAMSSTFPRTVVVNDQVCI